MCDASAWRARAISCLCKSLCEDPDPGVRSESVVSLSRINDGEVNLELIRILEQRLTDDPNADVRKQIARTFGKLISNKRAMDSNNKTIIVNGNYFEKIETSGGNYIQGDYINMSQNLPQAANQIQELLEKLQQNNMPAADAKESVAKGIATQAKSSSSMREKLIHWGQALGDATVTDVVKEVVKLALRTSGLPLP